MAESDFKKDKEMLSNTKTREGYDGKPLHYSPREIVFRLIPLIIAVVIALWVAVAAPRPEIGLTLFVAELILFFVSFFWILPKRSRPS